MSRNNQAQDWANKRKAAMEKAALLREQRKSGGVDEEQPSFAPQINRRPSYLKQPDSLDKLAGDIHRDPNDVFEQPLPGARGAQAMQSEYNIPNLPSPGSDALGKELKRYPSGPNDENRNQAGPYKSKFLNQFGSQQQPAPIDDRMDGRYPPQGRGQASTDNIHKTPVKQQRQEEEDEAFMSSLRGNNSGSGKKAGPQYSAGPGWNDDVSATGFGAPPKLKTATVKTTRPRLPAEQAAPTRDQARDPYADQDNGYAARANRRQVAQPSTTQARGEWNMDTEVSHVDAGSLPPPRSPRISPRVPAQRSRTDSAGAAVAAQPNLSLLKSKIRRSGSGQNMHTMQVSSTSSFSAQEDAYAADNVAEVKRNGRRSAPNPSFPAEENNYVAESRAVKATRPAVRQNRPEPDPYAESDPYGGGRYDSAPQAQQAPQQRARPRDPPQQAAPAYQPPSQQQMQQSRQQRGDPPPQQQQQQQPPRRAPADSRWDPTPDPFGPDAYPSGAAGIPAEAEYDAGEQMECPDCGRKFNPIPYSKHVKICNKVFMQKRKVFDSTKMRLAGDPEMEKLAMAAAKAAAKQAALDKRKADKAAAMGAAAPPAAAKFAPQAAVKSAAPAASGGGGGGGGGGEGNPKWKAESNAFREAMKAAREFAKAKAEGKPLPPPVASAPDPSLVPCPHCGRTFNQKAAERHIPQCQNIKAKPSALKRGAGGGGGVNGTLSATSAKGKKGGGFM